MSVFSSSSAPAGAATAPDAARCWALIPCAGSGSRAGLSTPKQYEVLAGQRLIDHTLQALLAVPRLHGVLVVLAPGDTAFTIANPRVQVADVGGATRAHSVYNGLQALRAAGAVATDWVLVHDAARCLVTPEQVEALLDACHTDAVGGLLALPLPDTLKAATGPAPARATHTIDRNGKWLAQTPQMFRWADLHRALALAEPQDFAGITDEASAIEALGLQPLLVRSSAQNFKVTYPEDFALAQAVLAQRQPLSHKAVEGPPFRIGEGWDVHALAPGRKLMLGGVEIPHHSGLVGHSDADALLHAITDALLGAAGLGDIGTHFPDTDPRFKGADSAVLLAEALRAVQAVGYTVGNVDCTVVAQAPKLAPYKAAMRERIAQVLQVAPEQVNVKAKTAEKLGPVGEGLSMEARATALLYRA